MDNPVAYLPQLAALAMAVFRILPSLGRIANNLNLLIFNIPSLNATFTNLKEMEMYEKQKNKNDNNRNFDEETIVFSQNVTINNISWKYEGNRKKTIDCLNMVIEKGASVGIIGSSGAGKSTLIDIILGLLQPQQGNIKVDGIDISDMYKQWSKIIGYVPQTVYLTNDTIRRNVAFGISDEQINDQLIWDALKKAQIDDFVRSLPEKLDTVIGDQGIRISGGQRQRISIARALYYNPEIIVFDEATSALDNETESAVMESIDSLHGVKTLIIVAHRLSTIKNCDKVYEIVDGVAVLHDKKEFE